MSNFSDQERMSNLTTQLDDATLDLQNANALIDDTINLEMDSLQELRRQKEVLEKDKDSLDRTNTHLDVGEKTLKNMLTRAICNKIFLICVAVILVIVILIIIILAFSLGSGGDDTTETTPSTPTTPTETPTALF